jgi:hypothetical protein
MAKQRSGSQATGLSLRSLMRESPPLMRNGSAGVVLDQVQSGVNEDGYPIVIAVTHSPGSKTKASYDTWVVGKDKTLPMYRQPAVLVQCSCSSYMYTFEVANHAHGAADIIYSNGGHPTSTNPNLQVALCRHLYALATLVMTQRI